MPFGLGENCVTLFRSAHLKQLDMVFFNRPTEKEGVLPPVLFGNTSEDLIEWNSRDAIDHQSVCPFCRIVVEQKHDALAKVGAVE